MLLLPEEVKPQLLLPEWVDLMPCMLYQLETKVPKQPHDHLMDLEMVSFLEKVREH